MPRQITSVYQLKIVLEDVRPQIMRRVLVPADVPLDALHQVLQVAMGWTDSHLHSFDFGDKEFTAHYEEGDLEELSMEDERGVPLSEFITHLTQPSITSHLRTVSMRVKYLHGQTTTRPLFGLSH